MPFRAPQPSAHNRQESSVHPGERPKNKACGTKKTKVGPQTWRERPTAGHAGQGQGDRTPEKSQRPHFKVGKGYLAGASCPDLNPRWCTQCAKAMCWPSNSRWEWLPGAGIHASWSAFPQETFFARFSTVTCSCCLTRPLSGAFCGGVLQDASIRAAMGPQMLSVLRRGAQPI